MPLSDILSHNSRRNDVVLEILMLIWMGYSAQDPKEVFPEVLLSLHPYATSSVPRNERLHLNVHEPRSGLVATEDVSIWGVTERYDG